MARGKLWTPTEDRTLMYNMQFYGFSEGRQKTSEELGRSLQSCITRSYVLKRTNGFKWEKNNKICKESAMVLKREIEKNPGNLRDAFRNTADKVGLKWHTVENMYYSKGTVMSRENLGISFLTIGRRIGVNRKNYKTTRDNKLTPKSILSALKALFR